MVEVYIQIPEAILLYFDSFKERNKFCKKYGYPIVDKKEYDDYNALVQFERNNGNINHIDSNIKALIFMTMNPNNIGNNILPYIVHELVHVVEYLADSAGINDEEYKARCMQFLFENLTNKLKLYKKAKKKNSKNNKK